MRFGKINCCLYYILKFGLLMILGLLLCRILRPCYNLRFYECPGDMIAFWKPCCLSLMLWIWCLFQCVSLWLDFVLLCVDLVGLVQKLLVALK